MYLKSLISIVIPVYNVEKYLEKCLQSVQNQTYNNFEVILVNDGSTDSSLSICEKFVNQDKRFSVFSKENGGMSSARNFGIKKAKGSFITFFCCNKMAMISLSGENYTPFLSLKQFLSQKENFTKIWEQLTNY